MNILVVNDDGYSAEGIRRLVDVLSTVADVYVCAPSEQMSGKSHSITIVDYVYMNELSYYPNAKEACCISGTPADCVKFGVQWMKKLGVQCDMVFSGINMGANLGMDVQYSGTVGAALEGAYMGIHSVALSVQGLPPKYYDAACDMAIKAIELAKNFSTGTVLNINAPNRAPEEIKGVLVTELGGIHYNDYFEQKGNDEGSYHFARTGAYADLSEESLQSDTKAVAEGYISITPLRFDITAREEISRLKELTVNE